MTPNLFSKEHGPFRLRTHEEIFTSLREILPNEVEVIFLRPHHLKNWFLLHFYGFDSMRNTYDPVKFAAWARKNHAAVATYDQKELLNEHIPPYYIGMEIEYLGVLKDTNSATLTKRDRQALTNLQITADLFEDLAQKTAEMYRVIWEMPDNSVVVLARVLDFQCLSLSQSGCQHCAYPMNVGNNTDEFYLEAATRLQKTKKGPEEIWGNIKVMYQKDSSAIEAVVFPLILLKHYPTILQIEYFVANRDWINLVEELDLAR